MQVSIKLRKGEWGDYYTYLHWCPACKEMHGYRVAKDGTKNKNPNIPDWYFDGNLLLPTFSPSMLIFVTENVNGVKGNRQTICHYFLTKGVISYCGDCPHEMKGMTVPLPDLPEEYQN